MMRPFRPLRPEMRDSVPKQSRTPSAETFRRYMCRGLGRCALILDSTEDLARYKETVLWGCLHPLSYDPQFEGTRAYYVYTLCSFFEDDGYFLRPTIDAYRRVSLRSDRLFEHLSELLRRFAEDGSAEAMAALEEKYALLYDALLQKRGRTGSRDYARDAFERLCLTLQSMQNETRILKIAADMGRLFRENPRYGEDDFDWFFYAMDEGIGRRHLCALLRREAKSSAETELFYERYVAFHAARGESIPSKKPVAPSADDVVKAVEAEGALAPSLRVRFAKHASEDERHALAEAVLREEDPGAKAELLSAFARQHEGFPLSHEALITYAEGEHPALRDTAREVLTGCQSKEVYAYGHLLLARRTHVTDALKMLISNYRACDKPLLLRELSRLRVGYRETVDWHGVGSSILSAKDLGVRLPTDFFLYVYETTLCSFCRECAVRALAARHAFTRDLIEECLYDSNAEISRYAQRYFSRR